MSQISRGVALQLTVQSLAKEGSEWATASIIARAEAFHAFLTADDLSLQDAEKRIKDAINERLNEPSKAQMN